MKKLFYLLVFQKLLVFGLSAQSVYNYTYKLDNGINVKTERCWNQVWVQQDFAALKAGDQSPLSVSIRTLGDLTSGSTFKLFRAGRETKTQGATPGQYDLKLVFNLSGKSGTLSFLINNIEIKPKTKTTVTITLYDYQITVAESPSANNGLSGIDSKVYRFKGNTDETNNMGMLTFFPKGQHDVVITPDEAIKKTSVKIKPGSYDVLISMLISGQTQKVWLENFTVKPDIKYAVSTNLNSGVIIYTGVNKDVKSIHLYPAGLSAKQTGPPAPVKNLEVGNYDNVIVANACRPGSYDVLLSFKNGSKFEWRKNIIVKTGTRTEIK